MNVTAATSKAAGRKESRRDGLPTLFRSSMFSERPALMRIITRASFLRSGEI